MLLCAFAACAALALVVAWMCVRAPDESTSALGTTEAVVRAEGAAPDVATELDGAVSDRRVAGAVTATVDARERRRAEQRGRSDLATQAGLLPGTLRVRVVDERGGVLAGLSGMVRCERRPARGAEVDDAPYLRDVPFPGDGVAVLEHLAFGAWTITVEVPDRDAQATVELNAGAPERDVDVVLAPWRNLRVRLSAPDGTALSGALEREFPGNSVLLGLELSEPNEVAHPADERGASEDDPQVSFRRDVEIVRRRGGFLRANDERDQITTTGALRCRRVVGSLGVDAPWRTLTVSSFGALSLVVRFGQLEIARGDVAAGREDVTLFATLDAFRAALRTLHVRVVDGATQQPLAGVSVRLRWDQVETTPPRFTDGDGSVTFSHELARKLRVDVVPRDHGAASEAVEILPDADASVTVRVYRPGTGPEEPERAQPFGEVSVGR